ncbi:MAG: hypothetical protein AMS24_03815 [Chlamydiae bacterium SM23_39]|nr:MAG: hypothetical protein AMS24_03815 [Chlamydiae bacterium SM23_39]
MFRSAIAPISSMIILIMGNAFFITYTSIRLNLEGHSVKLIGYVTSAYFAGLLVGSLKSSKLIERVGHIRAYAAFAAILSILPMIQANLQLAWTWIVIRFLVGFFIAGLFINIESWLLGISAQDNKGKIFAIYMTSYYASQGIAQFFLNISNPTSIMPFVVIMILSALSIIPVCITKISAPIIKEPSYLNISKLIKITPLGVIACAFAGFISGPVYGLFPVYAEKLGLSIPQISQVIGITIFSGLIFQFPLGQLSDHIDRRKVIIFISFALLVIAFLNVLNSVYSFLPILLLFATFGGFSFTIYPLSLSHASDVIEQKDLVSATAGLVLIYSIGAIIGPIIASYSINFFGGKGLFIYLSTMALLLVIYSLYQVIKKSPIPKDKKVQYTNIPSTTLICSKLDSKSKKE